MDREELLRKLDENRSLGEGRDEFFIDSGRIISVTQKIRILFFPDYFRSTRKAEDLLDAVYRELDDEIAKIDVNHEMITKRFMDTLPDVQAKLFKDIEAIYNGDPSATTYTEIVNSFPGFKAIYLYRIAHELYELKVPIIPRIITEYAHEKTGIDINPGAKIGEYFCIDHGTGIVVGDVVADIRMSLAALEQVAILILAEIPDAQRHAMIHPDVITDDSRFTDDDAGAMVDAEVFTDLRSRVDVDARLFMGILRDDTRDDRNFQFIQFMSDAIQIDRLESRKGIDDLRVSRRRRVAVVDGLYVLEQLGLHIRQRIHETFRDHLMIDIDLGDLIIQFPVYGIQKIFRLPRRTEIVREKEDPDLLCDRYDASAIDEEFISSFAQ